MNRRTKATARNAALGANRLKAQLFVLRVVIHHFINGVTGGVAIDHHARAGGAAQQLINRHVGRFAFDIPQRHIDRRDRRHGDRATTPVGPFVEVLPDVFDLMRIAADQLRADVIFQVGGDRQFPAIEGCITNAGQTLIGGDFDGDKVSACAGYKYFCLYNLHPVCLESAFDDENVRALILPYKLKGQSCEASHMLFLSPEKA